MEEIEEILHILNPWWKEGSISKDLAKPYKRKIFENIIKLLKYRQIIIISGLRRVGKTTLLYQTIEFLLKENDARKIVYFNFDKRIAEPIKVLESYEKLTNVDWKKEKIYVLFDEIVKLKDWANKIKLIYDAFPNIKFMLSSSSSISLEEEAIRSLAGRYFLINVKPLSFVEYLEMKNLSKFIKNPELWKEELKKEFGLYLLRNFPEIIDWEDEYLIKDYLRTTVIDKIMKEDLTEKFRNVNKDLLLNLLEIFYSNPGAYIDYDSLSKKFRISKKTLIEHIFYLEFSYLIRRIKNFRVNTFVASRKMQKIYANWWGLAFCYNPNYDKLIENVVASAIEANFYWRKNNKEIDFLKIDGKKVKPIEVKNKKEITENDLKNIKYFLEKYNGEGIVLYSGDEEREIKINRKKINLIPLWRWFLTQ
ncbi:MAG: ATP-binding protein [Candidatus Aenigmatarchaeota archaeon]